jgi:carbonic anhydrase
MRRASLVCCGLLVLAFAPTTIAFAAPAPPADCPIPPDPPLNPDQLWAELMAGNQVFVDGKVTYTGLRALRRATANRQSPPISILSCVDSRVMPEVTFDRTIGELFVARVAGNTMSEIDLAGLEFAVANGWTSVIVVMGHSDCGAIKAALATGEPGTDALKALVAELRKGIGDLRTDKPTAAELKAATENNVRYVADQLTVKSGLLRGCRDAGRLTIFKAYYDGWSGKVEKVE